MRTNITKWTSTTGVASRSFDVPRDACPEYQSVMVSGVVCDVDASTGNSPDYTGGAHQPGEVRENEGDQGATIRDELVKFIERVKLGRKKEGKKKIPDSSTSPIISCVILHWFYYATNEYLTNKINKWVWIFCSFFFFFFFYNIFLLYIQCI